MSSFISSYLLLSLLYHLIIIVTIIIMINNLHKALKGSGVLSMPEWAVGQ